MTPEQTRAFEIALSRYLGYTVRDWHQKGCGCHLVDPEGKHVVGHVMYEKHEPEVWQGKAFNFPRWSTDESLLSTLMKGLAGKGFGYSVQWLEAIFTQSKPLTQRSYDRPETTC